MGIPTHYRVGRIGKPHGIRGSVKVYLDHTIPPNTESLFVDLDGELCPFFITRLSACLGKAVMDLEGMNTPEDAITLAHKDIFLSGVLPETEDTESLSVQKASQWIGYRVLWQDMEIGLVKQVLPYPLNPMLVVEGAEKEILIPINPRFILKADHSGKTLVTDLPEGLLEL